MLQQTTVATVIPYFQRFLKSFPTVRRLARAPLENVLKQWAGLGYYARARNLHRTAQILMRDHNAKVPATREQAEGLPGVGPYTAGALLSFAYDQPEALVDGNVIRVLSRIFGIKGDTRRPDVIGKIWTLIARRLVPPRGAAISIRLSWILARRSANPACPIAPIVPSSSFMLGPKNGWVDRLARRGPTKQNRSSIKRLSNRRGGADSFPPSPSQGLWGGLWELPMVEGSIVKNQMIGQGGGGSR
jgi:A/G-specific adenine glycosylase